MYTVMGSIFSVNDQLERVDRYRWLEVQARVDESWQGRYLAPEREEVHIAPSIMLREHNGTI